MHSLEEIEMMLNEMNISRNETFVHLEELSRLDNEAKAPAKSTFIHTAATTTLEEDTENGELA